MNITKFRKGATLFIVLLFPSLLYIILSSGKHNFISRPTFGPKSVGENGDTIYHQATIPQVRGCNKVIKTSEFDSSIIIISFFSNENSEIGARVNSQMLSLQDRFRENYDVKLLSVSLDATNLESSCFIENNFPVLMDKWYSGSLGEKQLSGLIENLYLPEDLEPEKAIILLDKKRRIRSYRDGSQYVEVKTLADDIKVVKAEEFIPRKTKS